MSKKKEPDIYDAVAEYRKDHPEPPEQDALATLLKVISELTPLPPDDRARILKTVITFFDITF